MSQQQTADAELKTFTAICLGDRKVIMAADRPAAREKAIEEMKIRPSHRDWLEVQDGTPFGNPPTQSI